MALVIDASIILSWHFRDEHDPHPDFMMRLAEEAVVVPAHFEAEVANAVLVGERRGRTGAGDTARLIALLELMDADVDDEGSRAALRRVLPLARAHSLTVYDAIYLELAERRGLPLATGDRDLAAAARSVGIQVLA